MQFLKYQGIIKSHDRTIDDMLQQVTRLITNDVDEVSEIRPYLSNANDVSFLLKK